MTTITTTSRGIVLLGAILALSACQKETPADGSVAPPSNAASAVIQIDGSSTVFPITEAIAEEFQSQPGNTARVTVGVSGTGGGFKKFCRGESDISNASRPIQRSEMDACTAAGVRYFELPVAFDALTVVVNPQNSFAQTMTVAELKTLWQPEAQATVMRWNQVNPAWPDSPITLYGAGADSGTFDYFTEAVVGKAKSSRGDFTASEDDNVLVQGISSDVNAIGYFGYAYYAENKDKVRAVAVAKEAGTAGVYPSPEAVIDGSYQPLSRPMFVYVAEKSYARPEVKAFIDFYFNNVIEMATETKNVPLPQSAYDMVRKHLTEGRVGTVFHGEPATSITIEELLKRDASE